MKPMNINNTGVINGHCDRFAVPNPVVVITDTTWNVA